MTHWLPHNLESQKPYLKARMAVIKSIRSFFDGQDFWEVETPILQVSPVMDTHIHAFKTELLDLNLKPERDLYLHTSPEFAMKKLLVSGLPKIFQIAHVFRNTERSRLHSPEFTLLEWYRADADYKNIMKDCEDLLRHIASALSIKIFRYKGYESDPFQEWQFLSVTDAFKTYADICIDDCLDNIPEFASRITEQGIRIAQDDRWDDLFFRVMAEKIEPHLGMGAPTILYDYPASMASLSRRKENDPRFAERFELYICGVELANAFSELTDAKEQYKRFTEEMDAKEELYDRRYPIDEDFIKALEYGMPDSGGIALGLDRLVMLATDAEHINQVLWSPV